LDRSFTTKDYLEASQGLSIVGAVYMEVAVPPGQRREEAEYAIELCQGPQSLTRAAVIAGRPQKEQRQLFHDNAVKFYDLDRPHRATAKAVDL
jgi:predicted TIM-barrel fold metal-dependent hydrolase